MPSVDHLWEDYRSAVSEAVRSSLPKDEAGSDWIPTVEIGTYQAIAVPSLYGAEVVKVSGSDPMSARCFRSLGEALDAGVPEVRGAMIERLLEEARTAQSLLPENYSLAFAPTASPFDLAQLMLGEDFLISLIEERSLAVEFLNRLACVAMEVIEKVKDVLLQKKDESITNRGMFFPGYRLPSDAIVNYAPATIREVVCPVLRGFRQRYSRLCVHYCTQPSPSGHVLPNLLGSNVADAVDNWQGIEDFICDDLSGRMQDRIAVVGNVDLSTEEKMDCFLALEPIAKVPRRGGRGIVLETSAESVEQAQWIYRLWQDRMSRL